MSRNQQVSTEVVRPALLPSIARRYDMDEAQWNALCDAVFPSAKTSEGIALALEYCRARNLDPFKRPVHVVPIWNSKLRREVEGCWPGIGELRTTASRTKVYAGTDECEFGPDVTKAFKDSRTGQGGGGTYTTAEQCGEITFPEWARITVYKMMDGQRVPFIGPKVYFEETFSGVKGLRVPNSMWQRRPRGQLEKCAEAAALRRAFPEELGNEYTAEEMEGQVIEGEVTDRTEQRHDGPARNRPTREDIDAEDQAARGDRGDPQNKQSETQAFMETIRSSVKKTRTADALDKGHEAWAERADELGIRDAYDEIFEERRAALSEKDAPKDDAAAADGDTETSREGDEN